MPFEIIINGIILYKYMPKASQCKIINQYATFLVKNHSYYPQRILANSLLNIIIKPKVVSTRVRVACVIPKFIHH